MVKTRRIDVSRHEFEYEIPVGAAEFRLASCGSNVTIKFRCHVLQGDISWKIDEYEGLLEGIILAEVERIAADHAIATPTRIGDGVTSEATDRKIDMLKAQQTPCPQKRSMAVEEALVTPLWP